MKNKIFRSVPVSERLPEESAKYITIDKKGDLRESILVETNHDSWIDNLEYWLEPIELPTDPANLSSSLLANAIVGLDKEGARGLVKELCQHFGLLPSDEETYTHAAEVECKQDEELDAFRDGANFMLNHIKGGGV